MLRKIENAFVALNGWVLIVALAAMALVVGANVALRYTTNNSLPWADEVARYLMIWMTFLGAGLVLRAGGHVAITNLQDALPSRGQMLLRGLIVAILLGFSIFMVALGLEYMTRMGRQLTPATRISFSYIYAPMPIGFALLIVHLLLIAKKFILAGTYVGRADSEEMPGAAHG